MAEVTVYTDAPIDRYTTKDGVHILATGTLVDESAVSALQEEALLSGTKIVVGTPTAPVNPYTDLVGADLPPAPEAPVTTETPADTTTLEPPPA